MKSVRAWQGWIWRLNYLKDRFLIVFRLAKFAKLVWSTSPFCWWFVRRCVCELAFSCSFSKLNDPARDPVFSNAAMSSIVVKSDGFCSCIRWSNVIYCSIQKFHTEKLWFSKHCKLFIHNDLRSQKGKRVQLKFYISAAKREKGTEYVQTFILQNLLC